jgi:hypothetical protein
MIWQGGSIISGMINLTDYAVKALSSFPSSFGNISLSYNAVFLHVEEDVLAFQCLHVPTINH